MEDLMSTRTVNRREFITSGCTFAGAALLGATGCASDNPVAPLASADADRKPVGKPSSNTDLTEPRVIASVGGVLTATITASTNPAVVGGRLARQPVTYDGTFPGPTLWAHPGDTIDLTFVNKIVFEEVSL
jgi:FtsP/CotA-like multicopper oxidase with cupredoxin domain